MFNSSRTISIDYFDDEDLSSLQFWILIGVFISFAIVSFMVTILIVCYEVFLKKKSQFYEEYLERLKDFRELAGVQIEFNDLRSILMNEFILEAWKREKYKRERRN